jgi:hypothetical protein
MTFSVITLIIMGSFAPLSIMILSIKVNSAVMLSVVFFIIMLSVIVMLSITIKNATLSITALVTYMLGVIMLSGTNEPIMLSVIMPNAIILFVVAPLIQP